MTQKPRKGNFVACEQAFSRAERKSPPFLSLSSLFFPKQRACSQATNFGELNPKISQGSTPPDLSRSRKSVSIYSRSTPGLLPQSKNGKALTSTFISNKYNRQLASYCIEPSPLQKVYHTGLKHVFFLEILSLYFCSSD